MPGPLDLTGRRFGKLVVIEQAGSIRYGLPMSAWRCRCDCGVIVTVPRARLPYRAGIAPSQIVDACDACRLGRQCVVCGGSFVPASSRAITCSDVCRDARRHQTLEATRKRRALENPEAVRAAHARHRKRIAASPERYQAKLDKQKAWHDANKSEVNARRRAAREREAPEQRARRLAEFRNYMRAWQAELRADPDRHAQYLAMQAESRRKERLAALVRLGANLGDKL